ncbi:uncharacterized protein LOC116255098 [Nymphaea colorata]|uniref:Uncharacterized protein n=1 Tax=Nymphaea colorata TaxID=210225 RepID=A0A5K1DJ28_9MAGN|nr:uncharacterized protein LOC116255098 [Nymphaea colorata]
MNALCLSTAAGSPPPRLLRSPPPFSLLRQPKTFCPSRKSWWQLPELRRYWRRTRRASFRPAGKPEKEEMEAGEEVEEGEGLEEVGKEELEKLEEEALMGDDQGKEPMDYNRRAHIFYKSSEVFHDVKESAPPPPS